MNGINLGDIVEIAYSNFKFPLRVVERVDDSKFKGVDYEGKGYLVDSSLVGISKLGFFERLKLGYSVPKEIKQKRVNKGTAKHPIYEAVEVPLIEIPRRIESKEIDDIVNKLI